DSPSFTATDARVVAGLGRQLALALRSGLAAAAAERREADPGGPGLVVLDRNDEPESATIAAAAWLGELERAALPPALLAVAARVRSTGGPARARIRSATGRWL